MKRLVLALAGVVTLTASGASLAAASMQPAGGKYCYQNDKSGSGISIVSQNFEPSFNVYDSRAADDFMLPRACIVKEIDVAGWYNDSGGHATSLDVRFYENNGGTPGAPIAHRHDLTYTDSTGNGNFQIPLGTPVALKAGTYWLSVRTNMNYEPDGYWSWETSMNAKGTPAQWKNPGDGFATGCTTYTDLLYCIPSEEGPDFMFALVK